MIYPRRTVCFCWMQSYILSGNQPKVPRFSITTFQCVAIKPGPGHEQDDHHLVDKAWHKNCGDSWARIPVKAGTFRVEINKKQWFLTSYTTQVTFSLPSSQILPKKDSCDSCNQKQRLSPQRLEIKTCTASAKNWRATQKSTGTNPQVESLSIQYQYMCNSVNLSHYVYNYCIMSVKYNYTYHV